MISLILLVVAILITIPAVIHHHNNIKRVGEMRVVVEQTGIGEWLARVEVWDDHGWMDVDYCWAAASDSKQLHSPYDTIINYFEAPTAEEACEAAHHLIDVVKVRREWAASKRPC